MRTTTDVRLQRRGGLGHVELARPRALNALTHPMVLAMIDALERWAADGTVRAVLLTGAGERGLCAGGDVVALYRQARAGGRGYVDFWRDEYRLNALVADYPKPYVAVMDGLVLGGGVGISAHGSVRVVTERSRVGMPETGLGFAPDAGGSYLLARAPGLTGTHLALTAATMDGGDAIALGFADHYVPAARLGELLARLGAEAGPGDVVGSLAEPAPPSPLLADRWWIDTCYAAPTVPAILERLDASPEPRAREAARTIRANSPTALAVTLEALRRVRGRSLREALEQELVVSVRLLQEGDLLEGVRAKLVDKDHRPRWDPPDLDAVGDVGRFFVERTEEAR